MKKQIVFSFILLLLGLLSFAQEKPGWIYNKPTPTNSTYLYVVESATGLTELDARNQAFARVFQSTAMRIGQPINSEEINRAVQSGTDFNVISAQYNIPINKVCEYTEKQTAGYRVYILCQVAKSGNVAVDFDYGFNGCHDVKQYKNSTALLKSVFVPGLGQMGKRHTVEGVLTLVGELALVGGGVGAYLSAQNQLEIMKNANTTYVDYMAARDKYDTMKIVNIACYGAAAALYAFNLYRAYSLRPKYGDSFAFAPTVVPADNSFAMGVSLTYKF